MSGRRVRKAVLLTPAELAECWHAARSGSGWLRLNGSVIYALEDVLAFEAARREP